MNCLWLFDGYSSSVVHLEQGGRHGTVS